ncbi:hypothetical protein QE152_g39858 [Popillia japonica]|uniref:Uncharacterized protein n=1 Tax=Popillia japonica TaxID=7064 RepID=A0AAW1HTH5_POPJA
MTSAASSCGGHFRVEFYSSNSYTRNYEFARLVVGWIDKQLEVDHQHVLFGLPSKYDSDAQEYDPTSLPVNENAEYDTLAMEKEKSIIIQMDTEENDANEVHNAGWDDCTPEMLRTPLHPALKEKIGPKQWRNTEAFFK